MKFRGTLLAVSVCLAAAARAEDAPAPADAAMKEELAYIGALVDAGMPDIAEPVIAAARKKWPQSGPKLKVLALRGDLLLGKFDVVQKAIDGLKDKKGGEYWALRLSMADAYYARGMMKECREIYKAFFAAVPKPGPDLIDFYVESGFKWAQMCVNEKNYDEAVKMYGGLLERPLEEGVWCMLACEDVGLLLRMATEAADPKQAKRRAELLKQAEKYVDKLLWKNESQALYFGRAIAMKAHIVMLRGNLDGAQSLVNDYMGDLAAIHNSLKELDPDGSAGYMRVSPMPECRYLLAKILWDDVQAEAKKPKADEDMIKDSLFGARKGGKRNAAGAYNHAINVFVKYPESQWAAAAGEMAEAIAKFVKTRYGKEIKTNISPEQMKKVRELQFYNADEAYRGNDFARAVTAYEDILAQFPEAPESVRAVENLAASYMNMWHDEKDAKKKQALRISADAVEGYLGERFAGMKDGFVRSAGDALLRLAAKEHDAGALAREQQLYAMYFGNYPRHFNAAQTALRLGAAAMKAEDWEGVKRFYGKITSVYTNAVDYPRAVQGMAVACGKTDDAEGRRKWLRVFAQVAKKPIERTTAQLSLALMQQKQGFADFAGAAETNDTAAAEAMRKDAYRGVAGAIKDFRAAEAAIRKALEDRTVSKEEREKLSVQREQAMFLEGESWQRLAWPEAKVPVFRKQAVAAYERYLDAFPKGQYGAVALVKIGTIHTAGQDMEKSQEAFARLQRDFPDSDEARNSVPRLARTLMEMGLRAEGVKQYKQMLDTPGGRYSAGQFLLAGDALVESKEWDVAQEAYAKSIELAKSMTNGAGVVARSMIGQAKALHGAQRYAEAHQTLDAFIEKNPKSALLIDAYTLMADVAAEEGRREKDDDARMRYFNAAVGAVKKLKVYKKGDLAAQDVLDLDSADVQVGKMEAEEAMGLKEKAMETCGVAASMFLSFLQSRAPDETHPAKDMTQAQLANLERCYSSLLPLFAKLGKEHSAEILEYGEQYMDLFPDGKHKTAVQNAINQAKADM